MVTFSYLNLAEDTYPSIVNNTNAMDIILCRNVLMYFTPTRIKEAIQNLCHSLIDGGWLIVSQVEVSHIPLPYLASIHYPGAILYRKDSSKSGGVAYVPSKKATSYTVDTKRAVTAQPPVESVGKPKPDIVSLQPTKGREDEKPETIKTRRTPYERALALYGQGLYAEVLETLMGSGLKKQDGSKAMALLARACANQGRLAEALEWCQKACIADKLNPAHHYLLAIVMQEQGQMNDAVASLRRTLYLDPNFVLAHFTLGNLTQHQGKLKESRKHSENALLLLRTYQQDDILPESEGITAGRLTEIIRMTTAEEALA